jgi:hypothetical protein
VAALAAALALAAVLTGFALDRAAPSADDEVSMAEQERFCPEPEPRRRPALESHMAARARFGFRADKAYVRMLIRKDMWESDVGWIPVTPREDAYLRLRDRLRLGARANRYLRRHRELSGGISIEDDWPRGPYMLVRLTRDRKRHTIALRRLARYPENLRTTSVALSYRQLRRLQNRISFEAHTADGFHVVTTAPATVRNAVRIELITARTDHREYFTARYGPHVRTKVIARTLTSPSCGDLFGWLPGDGPAQVVLVFEAGGGTVADHAEVVEHADRVEVALVVQEPNGPRTADSSAERFTVTLAAPLGDRRIIDVQTGKRLRRYHPFVR